MDGCDLIYGISLTFNYQASHWITLYFELCNEHSLHSIFHLEKDYQ